MSLAPSVSAIRRACWQLWEQWRAGQHGVDADGQRGRRRDVGAGTQLGAGGGSSRGGDLGAGSKPDDAGAPRVLLAVSGGSDSMALAAAWAWLGRKHGIQVHSLTVDHGLREDSAEEASVVCERLESMGILAHRERIDVSAVGGPEAGARAGRYAVLASWANALGAPVWLGHTLEDQAETVLLGLGRGSGARSLAGMRAASSMTFEGGALTLLRPFLGLRKEELREALRREGVAWVEDPTNHPDSPWRAADGSMLRRAGVRHVALPALREVLGEGAVTGLARSAQLLQADLDALDLWAEREFAQHFAGVTFPVAGEMSSQVGETSGASAGTSGLESETSGLSSELAQGVRAGAGAVCGQVRPMRGLPEAVRRRMLRLAALHAGARAGELTLWHLERLDALVLGTGNGHDLDLPGAHARKREGVLYLEPATRHTG